jgi:hypothetical protein
MKAVLMDLHASLNANSAFGGLTPPDPRPLYADAIDKLTRLSRGELAPTDVLLEKRNLHARQDA